MRFSAKIFIAVFLTTSILGSAVIYTAHHYVSRQAKDEYASRYSTFSKVMGDALTRLDTNTESLMLNAARVVEAKDAEDGVLSNEKLKAMRSDLSVTHIFVTDSSGNFIRSTNEDPHLIPNAFSFCPGYADLISGKDRSAATPIIHPRPEPKPYKFVFVPSRDHQRLLEIGTRVDFIAKTLTEGLGSDSNVISMSLFAPDGTPFGRFSSKEVDFSGEHADLPATFPRLVDRGDKFDVFTKVASSHPQCCQCDVAGTSRNGEYYYVLKSEISKNGLSVIQATTKTMFLLLGLGNLLFAYILSRFAARRLVKNVERAAARVHEIKNSGSFDKRIGLKGRDEVAYLTNEFDHLLDSLEQSKRKIVEAEKIQAKVQVTRDVAHNIKSSVAAVEVMFPMLSHLPQKIQTVFRDSVSEIRELVDRLNRQADGLTAEDVRRQLKEVNLLEFVEGVVREKQIEYSNSESVKIVFFMPPSVREAWVRVDPPEFRAVISNVINNAIESYSGSEKRVLVACKENDDAWELEVKDFGCGIPPEVITNLGGRALSKGKTTGKGIGLSHAYRAIYSWEGHIQFKSKEMYGTTVSLFLPFTGRSATGQ